MAKVIIGGKEYTVPELNFVALERSWPYIEQSMVTIDPMLGSAAGLRIIAAGLIEGEGFEQANFGISAESALTDDEIFEHVVHFLKKQLKASELKNVGACINDIIEEAGLEDEQGELKAAAVLMTGSPSPETVLDTSSNSLLPELKEGAGTQ